MPFSTPVLRRCHHCGYHCLLQPPRQDDTSPAFLSVSPQEVEFKDGETADVVLVRNEDGVGTDFTVTVSAESAGLTWLSVEPPDGFVEGGGTETLGEDNGQGPGPRCPDRARLPRRRPTRAAGGPGRCHGHWRNGSQTEHDHQERGHRRSRLLPPSAGRVADDGRGAGQLHPSQRTSDR